MIFPGNERTVRPLSHSLQPLTRFVAVLIALLVAELLSHPTIWQCLTVAERGRGLVLKLDFRRSSDAFVL